MPKSKHLALALGVVAVLIQAGSLYVQVRHEQEHGGNYIDMAIVLSALLTLSGWGVLIWAVLKNLKDAQRAVKEREASIREKGQMLAAHNAQMQDLRDRFLRPATLHSLIAPTLLVEECDALLKRYRRLQADHLNEAKSPLNWSESWPDFNPPQVWTYVNVELCCLASRFDVFIENSKRVWNKWGWDLQSNELFKINKQTIRMVELIAAFEGHQRVLKEKLDVLQREAALI